MVCSATFLRNLTHRFLQWLVQKCKLHSEFRAWIQDPQIPLSMQDRQIHQSSRPRNLPPLSAARSSHWQTWHNWVSHAMESKAPCCTEETSDGIGGRLKLLANWLLYGTIGANIFIRGPNSEVPSDWNAIAEILWEPCLKEPNPVNGASFLGKMFLLRLLHNRSAKHSIFVSQCCPATCRKSWSQQFSSKYFLSMTGRRCHPGGEYHGSNMSLHIISQD